MTQEKNVSKPAQLWNQALKAVKGDTASQLVEQFTAEMTLVAEGLYEDQARLRQDVEALRREQERGGQSALSEIKALENTLREQQRDADKRLDGLERRLQAMEGKLNRQKEKSRQWMSQVLILAGMVCGSWVLVTILKLFQ